MNLPQPSSRLAAVIATPWLRRLLRGLAWTAVAFYFAAGLLVLAARHFVLPVVNDYRGDIEGNLSQALGRPVTIRAIDARWQGFWPNLRIHGLEIRDAEGRPALGLEEVQADIAWSSLWHLAPHFARLEIDAPSLDLRRTADGRYFVAGLELNTDETSGEGFLQWLLAQDRIVIRDATITWHDDQRRAPPLALSHVNLDLRNRGHRHRFGLTAEPPRELAARLDIRGDFRGDDLAAIEIWKGAAYAELDYADLAGWQHWVDYPIELPRGNGGLRLWLDFDRQALTGATADVRLSNTALRLAPDLPMLDMERLDGRIAGRRLEEGYSFQTRHLSLATRDGTHVESTDMDIKWQPSADTHPARGEASANSLDLGALAALAAHFPANAAVRETLVTYEPKGRVRDTRMAWTGDLDALATYSVKARFEDLGLRAHGVVPGFTGLDGRVEANDKGGTLELATRDAAIELPAVFEQSTVPLAVLNATTDWTLGNGAFDVRLINAKFQNDDAAGEASGRYRGTGAELGEIDLSANLTRANGGAVWRYMPLVVGEDVRTWLRESISGGAATASLRLKGDLKRFPFSDGSGIFEVKGPFHGAALRYAPDWPPFEDVTGDLQFVGAKMLIRAQRAKLWDVQLADVKAEIANLDAHDAPLVITGNARGPTADFLRFIEASPVGGYIDHVTEGMKTGGGGELRLRLDLPLHRLDDTRVDGRYRFIANDLNYDRDLPPISDINGELHFTEARLDANKVRAAMLGAPMTVDVTTEGGRVVLKGNGSMSVSALRQRYGYPLFEHLAGSAPWNCVIQAKKRAADVRFESSLLGISSSLPEPFNKTAGDVMPLVFERKPLAPPTPPAKGKRPATERAPGEWDQTDVSLGDAARMQFLRRHEEDGAVVEQGLIAINRPDARLPERGVLLAVQSKKLDVDFWRRLGGGEKGGGLPVNLIDLRADELRGFGRSLHALQLTGAADGGTWKLEIKSTEAIGKLDWTSREGGDRLSARLSRLDLTETPDAGSAQPTGESADRLPAIDLAVDHFLLHGREMGDIRLQAENSAGTWSAQFSLRNEDGELAAAGRWKLPQVAAPANTNVDFTLKAGNVERWLDRLGRPGVLRRGSATLSGGLSWAGAPTSIDYGSLSGKLALEASDGQFKKLEPGVGRLLGILSLQSLPRRISLDFRDIFSEGFAFDSITGLMTIDHGVMETSDFQIKGPAAKVLMNGNVNLVRETQDLKVRVQPTLGETVATGVILINPVVGATAWLMNRVFGNPLDKVFAFDYAVTGSWVDPKVDKVAAQGPGLTQIPGEARTP